MKNKVVHFREKRKLFSCLSAILKQNDIHLSQIIKIKKFKDTNYSHKLD
jgi:hypothetical protein